MLACHSSEQFKSNALHWDLAELPAELPAGLKGLQFILRSYFITSGINRNYRVKVSCRSQATICPAMKTLLMLVLGLAI